MRQEANAAVEMEHWGNMAKFNLPCITTSRAAAF